MFHVTQIAFCWQFLLISNMLHAYILSPESGA